MSWTAEERRFMQVDVQDFATEMSKLGIHQNINRR